MTQDDFERHFMNDVDYHDYRHLQTPLTAAMFAGVAGIEFVVIILLLLFR